MASSHSYTSTRRSSFSTFVAHQLKAKATMPKSGQCTHITMARLYTSEFQCTICLRNGSFGWLYRCTQDRETLIENDIELGREEKLDDICDLFPKSNNPKSRSSSARQDRLSLLNELSEEQFHTYTPAKLGILLKQRSDVLDTLSESCVDPQHCDEFFPAISVDDNKTPSQTSKLLPARECQFKCCPACRPMMRERSYLSLNGILDGDLPATATTGFGFHLQKQRPVGSIEHVRNLGLRPTPPLRPISTDDTLPQARQCHMFLHGQNFGLGISNGERESESGNCAPSVRFSLDNAPPPSSKSNAAPCRNNSENEPTSSISSQNSLPTGPYPEPVRTTPRPLPIPPTCTTTPSLSTKVFSKTTPASLLHRHEQHEAHEAHSTPELLTHTEKSEENPGVVPRLLPLAVPNGVAVTEEDAVGNHVASVITQV